MNLGGRNALKSRHHTRRRANRPPARGPPDWGNELVPLPDYDAVVLPVPEFQYDQRISW